MLKASGLAAAVLKQALPGEGKSFARSPGKHLAPNVGFKKLQSHEPRRPMSTSRTQRTIIRQSLELKNKQINGLGALASWC